MAYVVSLLQFGVLWWHERKRDRRVLATLQDLYDAEDTLVGLHYAIVGLAIDVNVVRFYVRSTDETLNALRDEITTRFDRQFVLPGHMQLDFEGKPWSLAIDLCA